MLNLSLKETEFLLGVIKQMEVKMTVQTTLDGAIKLPEPIPGIITKLNDHLATFSLPTTPTPKGK